MLESMEFLTYNEDISVGLNIRLERSCKCTCLRIVGMLQLID